MPLPQVKDVEARGQMMQEIKVKKHDMETNLGCYSVFFLEGKIYSVHATLSYDYLLGDMEGVKERSKGRFMFLFLLRKKYEATSKTCNVWSGQCLREVGWGPPEQIKKIMTHQNIVQFCLELITRCKRLHAKNKACNHVGLEIGLGISVVTLWVKVGGSVAAI